MSISLPTDGAGRVVTFYSYKGGVGRSMALANIAIILARDFGLRVVAIDWDLEAPGLNRYFDIDDDQVGPGIIDYFTRYKQLLAQPPDEVEISAADLDIRNYVHLVESYADGGTLSFLSAGEQRDVSQYVDRVSGFDWDDFYRNWNGAQLIEAVRVQLSQLGDVVLIDSRTGITDTGGICTLHLPDLVVLVFVFNDQNLDGIARIAAEISGKNAVFEITKRHPEVLFLPSRKDVSEIGQLREWEAKAVALFEPFFNSPRITDRFGDHGLDYIRAASVPYVPYFAFGEELAATTDKGYEMTAALEVLAEILSDRAALPRKGRKAQMQSPRREPSFPGRARSGPLPQAVTSGGVPEGFGAGMGSTGAMRPTPSEGIAEADEDLHHGIGRRMWGTKARPRTWVRVTVVAGLVSALVLIAGEVKDAVYPTITEPLPVDPPHGTESSYSGEPADGGATGIQVADQLDRSLLRAVVRFEFLAIYPRDQPAPKVFDGSVRCEFAFGTKPGPAGWTRTWQLQNIEQELKASMLDDLQLVENAQNVAYRAFESTAAVAESIELEHVADLDVEARLVGPGASPGWLTEAWARAGAQGLAQDDVVASFRKFYGVAESEVLLVDVTPVVATMQVEYDGRPFASLNGWVARDPKTRDLVVNFVPTRAGDPIKENPLPPVSASMAPYLEHRDQNATWLAEIQGVGTYSEDRGGKRHYQLGIAAPPAEIGEIESVTYRFGDGSSIVASKAGPSNDWPVVVWRKSCEGTVSIELRCKNGVTLPASFDWCQDAVKVSAYGKIDDPSQTSEAKCNPILVAKNPRLAQEICAQEYDKTTIPEERARLLESIISAHRNYGNDGDYCWWLEEAEAVGDATSQEFAADKARCETVQRDAPSNEGRMQKKPGPR